MYYVYLLESISDPNHHYVGFSTDLRRRLLEHNTGKLPTTSPHRPWRLSTYLGFSSKKQALAFEHYLKSGSGHAFARKRLWFSASYE
jgi:predicted GIY-YIG superfamily endonuclease